MLGKELENLECEKCLSEENTVKLMYKVQWVMLQSKKKASWFSSDSCLSRDDGENLKMLIGGKIKILR